MVGDSRRLLVLAVEVMPSTLSKAVRGEFSISAWGIYTKQKLLITCDSRASAESLLDPDETLVRVVARCTPAKKRRK